MLAVAGLVAASVTIVQAQSYYLAGNFEGWCNNCTQMTSNGPVGIGGNLQYSYQITGQTPNSWDTGGMKVTDGSWANTWPGNNMYMWYNANSNATIYFYPATFTDGFTPTSHRVGFADPGLAWEVTGDFGPNWGSDPKAQMTLLGGSVGVYTNTYMVTNAGTYSFKFRTPGTWNNFQIGTDFSSDNNGNGSVTTTANNQKVLFTLDLPNGRWQATIPGLIPVTNQVVFSVDMTSQIQQGYFTPGSAVFVAGAFNGWPPASTGNGLVLTNYPPFGDGSNTNIYYGTNQFIGLPGSSATTYKFNDNDPNAQNSGWETSNDRTLTLLTINGPEVLNTVPFNNFYASDFLLQDTLVTFTVDMTNIAGGYVTGRDGHTFNPANDGVFVNGQFANYGGNPQSWEPWFGGVNPVASPYQLKEVGFGSVYTNTFTIPAGTPVAFLYKYGIDTNLNVDINAGQQNAQDDEAGTYSNHVRVIRSTAMNPYVLPTDNFGNMYSEPYFDNGSTSGGNLTMGSPAAGMVPVSWLGRPGAYLQFNTNVTGGSWQNLIATDGTNWTAGYSSTNGFVSVTNWPASGTAFFRLVRP